MPKSQSLLDSMMASLVEDPSYTMDEDIWIGLENKDGNGDFVWTDETLLATNTGWDPWHGGQPNNQGGRQDCVEMWHKVSGVKFNDDNCAAKNHYVCQSGIYTVFNTICMK